MGESNRGVPVQNWTEAERLAALQGYGILDTPSEPEFDSVARVAAIMCRTSVALVNFLAEDRQWFKAETGFGRRETPIDIAFCAHALRQPDVFVVPDAHKDIRFSSNPLVTQAPFVRFYAGALVHSAGGLPIGTVCVLDSKPREGLTLEQFEVLVLLSQQVTTLLEYRSKLASCIWPGRQAAQG